MVDISVILPTFNGQQFLAEQIDSILSQDHANFELLTLDDGSTDATVTMLDDYARRDKRVRRLASVGNRGQNRRLVELLGEATGRFVAIADQDDFWRPDRNRLLLEAIGSKAVAFGRSQLIDEEGADLGRSVLDALDVDPHQSGTLRSLFRPLVSAHAAIVRREWIDPAAFYHAVPFDWMFAVEAMLSTGLVYVDDAVVEHRIHGGNQMNGAVIEQRRRLSLYRLREATSFVRKERLYLFTMLECLGRSLALPPSTRRSLTAAAHACRYTWYQPLDFKPGKARQLERSLDRLLGPFASSDRDRQFFHAKVRSLTRPQASPINVVEAYRRYGRRVP